MSDIVSAAANDPAIREESHPDWERFGKAMMAGWPDSFPDGFQIQDWAETCAVLRKEPYDPEKHGEAAADEYDVQPGDDWFVRNYKDTVNGSGD